MEIESTQESNTIHESADSINKDIEDYINPIVEEFKAGLEEEYKKSLDILDKFPYEISGGQRQRCACARAIATNPSLILADEPTGALDSHSAKQLLETFVLMCQEYEATILMVTHDGVCYGGFDELHQNFYD